MKIVGRDGWGLILVGCQVVKVTIMIVAILGNVHNCHHATFQRCCSQLSTKAFSFILVSNPSFIISAMMPSDQHKQGDWQLHAHFCGACDKFGGNNMNIWSKCEEKVD